MAFGSAAFAGAVAILAKLGYSKTDSDLATALRTVLVLVCAWGMVFLTGKQGGIGAISGKSWLFLVLSGLATGGSWLCYFHALQIGDIDKVTPVDKSSTILTILLAALILGEALTPLKAVCVVVIGLGTALMIVKKGGGPHGAAAGRGKGRAWFFYALGSAVFASLTSILTKLGITGVDSVLGTAIRTGVVLVMAWLMVFVKGSWHGMGGIDKKSWLFLVLSGLATGGSWLCQNRALQLIDASVVIPIDKLSIVITVAFSYLVFGEKLSKKAALGLALLVAGTLGLLLV